MQTLHYRTTDNFPESWWRRKKGITAAIFSHPERFRLQVIYTQIDRDEQQRARFTDYCFRSQPGEYSYPASTVKLPAAILAMEKLRMLNIPGLDLHTPLTINGLPGINPGVAADRSARNGLATLAHYIKKIFLISDNDAYNRLYEFLGQETFNRRLWECGYPDIQIRHRVGLPLHEAANRHTNSFQFRHDDQVIYEQPETISQLEFLPRHDFAGNSHIDHTGSLEHRPMDFSIRNRLPLSCLHDIMKRIFFPGHVTNRPGFRLTDSDYQFLYRCMSQYPTDSADPVYDPKQYHQAYVKFLLYGGQKSAEIPAGIRIFNKPGWAYGFLTDTAYIVDLSKKIEFLLSATLYVNKDGVIGNDHYEFEETGKPFLRALGEMIYEHESERPRKIIPDLSRYQPQV
ncbi:serine hydrolase [Chitinophaga sp. Cy-1792]|uniref:serine hydrolase n=1 Tax=Chitinophaga sp. Cy-1792 TaxID=2608339 RepID=UPI00142140B4|nr:serine hydrolase [Chitinophaga sp. Cy-1792]NIG57670.1 serine hydrolase [Chitinophaga sp. Cy-1792]